MYPEQLEAAVKLMQGHNIHVDFPMDQSCCGLPVVMMGQRETARDVALQNMDAFEKGDYDVILTLCASCASQLKEGYVELFAGQPGRQARAKALADKVMDFSTFAKEKLGLKVGIVRPITVWPYPYKAVFDAANQPSVKEVVSIEMSCGQMVDDVKIAVNGVKPEFVYRKHIKSVFCRFKVNNTVCANLCKVADTPQKPVCDSRSSS